VRIGIIVTPAEAISLSSHAIDSHHMIAISLRDGFNETMPIADDLNRVPLLCHNSELGTLSFEPFSVVAGMGGFFVLWSDELIRFKAILGQGLNKFLLVLIEDCSSHRDHDCAKNSLFFSLSVF